MVRADPPLLILGTRTLAEEVLDLASEIPGLTVAGFVENQDRSRCSQKLEGLPIYWVDDVAGMAASHQAVCALATTKRQAFIDQVAAMGFSFATLIHPSASISARTVVGAGCIINRGVCMATRTRLGRHVLVNRGALIGHHTTIGDYCTIQPGANIAGACRVGERTFVGMGALVMDHLTVGAQSVIAAGAVVTGDVPDRVQVMGMPARVVKEDIDGL